MDIESLLRQIRKTYTHHEVQIVIDSESRVRIVIDDQGRHEYIVLGDRFVEPPIKPPTQVCAPTGFEVFGGMGAR